MNQELLSYKKYVDFNLNKIADIGANIGEMTQFFIDESSKNTKIICVEPHEKNIEILKQKFENIDNVDIKQGAISINDGLCSIGLEEQQRVNGLKQGHVLCNQNNNIDLQKRNWNNKINNVECWKLETLCNDCELIKMDIEGFEHKILYNCWFF